MDDTVLEQHSFGAEVGRLLDLVVHSLYSEREIFLRELVANAADAVDRRRFEALTDSTLAPPPDAKIRIVPDKEASTLLISDDGIGMTRQELIDNLGTIARSGTRAFAQNLASAKAEDRPNLIGQFGVGFYSAFMVADRVEVTSRKAGGEEAFTWASEGAGQFTLAPATRDQPGTDIVLHIKSDAAEYLEPIRLETVIRKWADPIDSFWPERLDSFEGKKLRSVTQAAEDLGKGEDLPDIAALLTAMKDALGDRVSDVRATARLSDSAVVLASDGKGPDLAMQRLMRRSGRATMPVRPVLEVNPRHRLIEALLGKLEDTALIVEASETLLDLAQVQEGDLPADATAFARRVTTLMAASLG